MENKKYWDLVFDNFEGYDDIYHFSSYEIAKKNLEAIIQKYQNEDVTEFEYDDTSVTWFDANYNEYSTYIYLVEHKLPTIYDTIIF